MSRQDKATTERFTRTLRELVKKPENKVCADCKRNDPRWASWNLGVFLCIRCSGIHRGMGTHISKVKSVDLDTWTPEQMESIQKWGNRRANLYWEAHLKAGHIPADHKMESFVRSKYESKRWALDGPPPRDPSVLEQGASAAPEAPPVQASPPPSVPRGTSHNTSSRHVSTPSQQPATVTSRQPHAHQLLSASHVNQTNRAIAPPAVQAQTVAPAPAPAVAPADDLFSLDFHAPAAATPSAGSTAQPAKNVKQDILSLFSTPAATSPTNNFGQPAGVLAQSSPWAQQAPAQNMQYSQPTSMMGQAGAGMWGVSSGWNAPAAQPAPPAQGNLWGAPAVPQQQQQQPFGNALANTNDVWGSTGTSSNASNDLFSQPFASGAGTTQKKDDVFGDLWGGFK
ncbi:hypothetical protein HGRIS_007314 [Hohenbuehelia grisea]|uniref:Arf-GAP domain-containing protein n=1 Tax=Hohenbuehelia grisea TaxID=104357 RepID=A0ABR3J4X3_9AGAR